MFQIASLLLSNQKQVDFLFSFFYFFFSLLSSRLFFLKKVFVGTFGGQDTSELLKTCVDDVSATFDIIILADLLFNHSEHKLLLQTCQQCLSPGGQVFFYLNFI